MKNVVAWSLCALVLIAAGCVQVSGSGIGPDGTPYVEIEATFGEEAEAGAMALRYCQNQFGEDKIARPINSYGTSQRYECVVPGPKIVATGVGHDGTPYVGIESAELDQERDADAEALRYCQNRFGEDKTASLSETREQSLTNKTHRVYDCVAPVKKFATGQKIVAAGIVGVGGYPYVEVEAPADQEREANTKALRYCREHYGEDKVASLRTRTQTFRNKTRRAYSCVVPGPRIVSTGIGGSGSDGSFPYIVVKTDPSAGEEGSDDFALRYCKKNHGPVMIAFFYQSYTDRRVYACILPGGRIINREKS